MCAACPWSLLCYQIVPDIFFNGIQTFFVAKWFHDEFYFALLNSKQRARDNFPIVFWSLFLLYIGSCRNTGSHGIIQVHQMMIISRLLHCLGRPQDMYLNSVIAKQLETTTFLFTPSSVRWKLTTNKKHQKTLGKNGHEIWNQILTMKFSTTYTYTT